jgi:hypothetical protein
MALLLKGHREAHRDWSAEDYRTENTDRSCVPLFSLTLLFLSLPLSLRITANLTAPIELGNRRRCSPPTINRFLLFLPPQKIKSMSLPSPPPSTARFEGKCVVCGTSTTFRCGDCDKAGTRLYFCSIEHKRLVISSSASISHHCADVTSNVDLCYTQEGLRGQLESLEVAWPDAFGMERLTRGPTERGRSARL